MPTNTTYYGLSKPLGTENVNIGILNANSDIIDTEMNRNRVRAAVDLAPIYDSSVSYVEDDYCTYLTADGYKLYKCIADTTGAFDSNAWAETDVVSNLGSGGGAGGGHEILDDSGTTLTQRDKMQFIGAYSEDNSTDRITEVNVMRSMTRLEYEALTSAEKQGIIYVEDETTGTDDKFQPVIYSLEEREIGVWTDGKPLYEKTITFNCADSAAIQTAYTFTDEEVKRVKDAVFENTNGDQVRCTWSDNHYWSYTVKTSTILVSRDTADASWQSGVVFSITIQYTKTTDTAGSGQWTPQGVPAVHYSTDEQVVGTWIDGSTLYQKTWLITAPSSANSEMIIDLSSYDVEYAVIQDAFIISSNGYNVTHHGGGSFVIWQRTKLLDSSPKDCIMCTVSNASYQSGIMYVTLQYTKTS